MNEKPETDQHASLKSGGAHDHFSISTDYSTSRDQLSPPVVPESNNRLREPVRSPRDLSSGRKSRSPYATQKRRQSVSRTSVWIILNVYKLYYGRMKKIGWQHDLDGKNGKRSFDIG